MAFKSKKGFQVGDILCPLPGKTQSNYWQLKNINKVEVTAVNENSDSIQIKLLDGHTYNRRNDATRDSTYDHESYNETFWVYDNAFQAYGFLRRSKTDDYEVY